jgi:hypothetical protein
MTNYLADSGTNDILRFADHIVGCEKPSHVGVVPTVIVGLGRVLDARDQCLKDAQQCFHFGAPCLVFLHPLSFYIQYNTFSGVHSNFFFF